MESNFYKDLISFSQFTNFSYLSHPKIILIMKIRISLSLLSCLLISANGQFTATMQNTVQGRVKNYTVYSDTKLYRYDFIEAGQPVALIVNPEKNTCRVLMPEKKFYQETECDASLSRRNDPWQAYIWFRNFGREISAGNEKLEGYSCKKLALYQNETKAYIASFSEQLNFPVYIKNELEPDTYMKLSNIKSWSVDSTFFRIPKDYILVDRYLNPVIPEPPPPDTWQEFTESVPIRSEIKRGTKVLVSIPENAYYKFIIQNNSNGMGKLCYSIFENGVELPFDRQGEAKYRTFRLHPGESKTLTQNWKTGYEVQLKLFEGTLGIEIAKE